MQWPLSYCIDMFCSTASEVFVKKRGMKARLKRLLRLHRVGAQYDIAVFCDILKSMFGDTRMREGIVERKQDGVRVAITSTTFDAKLCLYRSYGDVLREGDRGDWMSQDFSDLRLWQAYVIFSLLYLPTVLKLGALTFLSLYLVLRQAAPPH
jgi:hypothetical protein